MMRLLASILLSVLLLHSVGPLALLQWQQQQIRREMKRAIRAGLPEDRLIRFVFVSEDRLAGGGRVEWIEAHEFRHRGVMYDIARTVVAEGRTVRYCVRDDAETAVYAQLDRLAREESNSDPDHRRNSARLVQQLLLPAILPDTTASAAILAATPWFPSAAARTLRGGLPPPTPPPRG